VARIPQPEAAPGVPRPHLEIRDLEIVLSLAAAGSTAGAASALHITQSAVSRALAQAEDRIGARLFERTARGVLPTVAGERLVAGAGQLLAELCRLEHDVAAPPLPVMKVRLVCECYTAYRWLLSAMEGLRRRNLDLDVEVAVEHTHEPVDALVRKQIDIALLTTAPLPRGRDGRVGLVEQPLFSDEIVFLVADTHPLANAGALTRRDLRQHPLITSHTPPAEARWFLAKVFGRHVPKLTFVPLPLTEAIIDAARAGMGIAVLSEWMASGYLAGGGLTVKRLHTGALRRPWRIAYRAEVAEAAQRLTSTLVGAAPRLNAGSAR
jgi:LysR family transcriptional regulator for metE and metH